MILPIASPLHAPEIGALAGLGDEAGRLGARPVRRLSGPPQRFDQAAVACAGVATTGGCQTSVACMPSKSR